MPRAAPALLDGAPDGLSPAACPSATPALLDELSVAGSALAFAVAHPAGAFVTPAVVIVAGYAVAAAVAHPAGALTAPLTTASASPVPVAQPAGTASEPAG